MFGLKIPCRGSPEAPSFSGRPEDLRSYFDDIIDFCDRFGLSDGLARIKFALKYAPVESVDLWSHLADTRSGDWCYFTSEVILALSSGLWKSSKVNSSCVQPSHASDSHSPHHSYLFCFFCRLSGHIRAGCHSYKSYLASGKCLLVNGRVVLPTGQEIPREVAGRTLQDRLDNWSSLASQFETRRGSSLTHSLLPTAAPSRSVFNTPARIPTRTSIMYPQSLPTVQLEPAVPDPPAILSRRSSAECSRSSPHAQPQSRWPCGRGRSPLRPHSRSHSQTRTGSYTHSKDDFIPVQSYARSLIQHHTRRRSYSYSTNSSLPSSSSSSSSSRLRSRSHSRKAYSYIRSKPKRSRSHSRTPRRSRRVR
ncbi:hypothetical protein M404DRAFT_994075 [Pisolithus tinctorius Marx 270]|uniref:CCHC-type domain-containing protein n=1 Tax=Pisolithus tinctorius Marx 270 TaxID=870435 RepID=A0A0C3JS83_PISTI|nr:hypothetical protein M404DRAFT_994075 [Pisolithus tinctorius Marx 270]